MRVQYVPASEQDWVLHYQRGGFIGIPYQRGCGLGSVFRSLFRAILPIAKSAGKVVGKRALQAGAEIASDLVAGKNFKSSLEQRGKEASIELLDKASKNLKGGRRRRKGAKRTPKRKKQRGGSLGRRTIKGSKKTRMPVKKRKVTKRKQLRETQIGVLHL